MARSPATLTSKPEECWVLLGQRRGGLWYARRASYSKGRPESVAFDAAAVLEREERRGDVVGFYHTHPAAPAQPSARDLKTMRAWVSCFGKPLLCVIEGVDGIRGYCFEDDNCSGMMLSHTQRFAPGVVIGVDDHGR